ncbi:MAG: hypothetical protein OHK93_005423 [Ramalina farinacea]|uniref:Uncharacterized protein n=1 Tax=Ramalina farinacea TaxID=258253 RepID=A0AA43TVX3_9LECA|nr:hypothetical protein [Ramalina farinacea]
MAMKSVLLTTLFLLITTVLAAPRTTSKASTVSTTTASKASTASTTSKAPTATATCISKSFNATFDDLAALPDSLPGDLTPIPTPYKDLAYANFDLASTLPGVTQLIPESGRNVAFAGGPQRTLGLKPAISVAYAGSPVTDFTLKSIAYACVLTSGGNLDAPTACTARATAFRGNAQVGTADLNYAPPTLLGAGGVTTQLMAGMLNFAFPAASFGKVTRVEFALVEPVPATTVVNFVIDDAAYVTDENC